MMYRIIILFVVVMCPLASYAQEDSIRIYIAPYKNDAAGAYTIVHDDFGGTFANGIEEYADTIAFNRNIPFCFAIITKLCDETDWDRARSLMRHGHQPVNHSHSHLCGTPQSWCTFGDWDEKDFPVEIDQSTTLIQENTGVHPAFFMFPFDLHTDTMITYLIAKGYAGTRAGTVGQVQMSATLNPFRHNYVGLRPEQPFEMGNQYVDQAILKKGWAIRVTHGVADESWGAPSEEDYRAHLDYVKQKVEANQLWVATMSDVLWYITQQRYYELKVTQRGSELGQDGKGHTVVGKISFSQVHTNPVYTPDEKANEKTLKATASSNLITIVIIQARTSGALVVRQNNKKLTSRYSGEKLLIEADPEGGEITLEYLH